MNKVRILSHSRLLSPVLKNPFVKPFFDHKVADLWISMGKKCIKDRIGQTDSQYCL